jgi:uncharacterized membrane protein YcgQ (UPF0703/DUF1980 family)
MTIRATQSDPFRQSSPRRKIAWRLWIEILALGTWSAMLMRYWFSGKLGLLLHPDYMWLSNTASVVLAGLAGFKAWQLLFQRQVPKELNLQHFSLFPKGWSSAILLAVAVFGLVATRAQPQQFGNVSRPEERSLVGWIRTLNVYPEPDAYAGQTAKVDGFVIHSPDLPDSHFVLARFIITCCAADAYPVGLPVKLPEGDRTAYPPDTWLSIEGQMTTETLNDERRLVIAAQTLTEIPEPANPYDY